MEAAGGLAREVAHKKEKAGRGRKKSSSTNDGRRTRVDRRM